MTAVRRVEADEQEALRFLMYTDFPTYAEANLKIRTKLGTIQPLKLNAAQLYVNKRAEEMKRRKGYVRMIVLKGRQQGISTFITARFYWLTSQRAGLRAFILTHEMGATDNLFAMTSRFHEHCPEELRPATKALNAKELTFASLDSSYGVGTAGNKAVGVSQTIQLFHGSEVALWPNADDHVTGIMQAVPLAPGTEVWLESTSRGMGNLFYLEVQKAIRGEGEFEFCFVPWFWQDEYRVPSLGEMVLDSEEAALVEAYGLDNDQIAWRRLKVVEMGPDKFRQEYPVTPEQAFEVSGPNVLIGSSLIRSAVDREVAPVDGPVIWGVDCSLGGDRSTLAKRKTNKLLEPVMELLKGQDSYDTIAVARAVLAEYRATPPSKRPSSICVDSIGIGAGVSAQMRSDNLPVIDVNVGERPSAKARFNRLRDELWWEVREWFSDMRTSMPLDEPLIFELAGVTFDNNTAAGRVKIEGKKDMIKRLKFSPDKAEAFMLTFAASDQPESGRSFEPAGYEGEVG
jgi:hypothetical protein